MNVDLEKLALNLALVKASSFADNPLVQDFLKAVEALIKEAGEMDRDLRREALDEAMKAVFDIEPNDLERGHPDCIVDWLDGAKTCRKAAHAAIRAIK